MRSFLAALCLLALTIPYVSIAQSVATTTLTLSICGNGIVDSSEECDVPGETGLYSQTIAGRQCNASCFFGPYCGDGILQTAFAEQCDDGNTIDGDGCDSAAMPRLMLKTSRKVYRSIPTAALLRPPRARPEGVTRPQPSAH